MKTRTWAGQQSTDPAQVSNELPRWWIWLAIPVALPIVVLIEACRVLEALGVYKSTLFLAGRKGRKAETRLAMGLNTPGNTTESPRDAAADPATAQQTNNTPDQRNDSADHTASLSPGDVRGLPPVDTTMYEPGMRID